MQRVLSLYKYKMYLSSVMNKTKLLIITTKQLNALKVMKMTIKNLRKLITIIAIIVFSIPASAGNWPKWLDNAVFYQIYPSSYKDSDGNGIGDIPGITSKLDYIKSLGINALWLNPVFESGWFDGGYDVIDFYKVDPRFGTNTDLVNFVKEAHKRGIKVCLDLVAGHTSNKCEWFRQSSEKDRNQRYSNYYIWTDSISQNEKNLIAKRNEQPNPKECSGMGNFVEANAPRGKYYEKNFYECQPALNYGYANPNPKCPWQQSVDAPGPRAMRQEMKNIMAFWMDKGVDGFRVDMASSLVKNDPYRVETVKLWHEMRAWMDKNYPDNALISEWSEPNQAIPAGFHVDFLIYGTAAIPSLLYGKDSFLKAYNPYDYCYFDKSGKGRIDEFINYYQKIYNKTKEQGYICIPTSTHDRQRLSAGNRNTVEQLKVAMTFFLTMPGVPLIYYGDEIGMRYQTGLPSKEGSKERAGTRTPMQWENNSTAGFSSCSPEKLYLPVLTEGGKLTVAEQEKDKNSLLNYTKKLISLKKSTKALENNGKWEVISDVKTPYPLVYKMSAGDESYVIALNPGENNVEADVTKQNFKKVSVVLSSGKGKYFKSEHADKVKVLPFSAVIFRLNK